MSTLQKLQISAVKIFHVEKSLRIKFDDNCCWKDVLKIEVEPRFKYLKL